MKIQVDFNINNDQILIKSDSTIFENTKRIKKLNKQEIINQYNELIQFAKKNKITICKKNKYKKYINDNFDEYIFLIEKYNNMFDQLIIKYKEIEKNGIHYGYCNDNQLNNVFELSNEYKKIFYRSTIYSRMTDIYNLLIQFNLVHSIHYRLSSLFL